MDPVQTLIEKLEARGDLAWSETQRGVKIDAPLATGFSVELEVESSEYFPSDPFTVFLGESGFHMHFNDASDVLECIAWCFSGEARVVEVFRGNSATSARLERAVDGRWELVEDWGRIGIFSGKKRLRYLRNPNLLRSDNSRMRRSTDEY